ncbi:subtilase-type protease inhibitor [Streptomyces vilmorinianum]|uniref:subtilase-type protease inhibitor n=1 Tax=Streptomyces vilmorinianum TaxID=3051092 RepID=UPI0020C75673|nr:subtilase-type protease inhibitor [Streptomyces vilmorinianum]
MRYLLRNTAFTTALATGVALIGAATGDLAQAEPATSAAPAAPAAPAASAGLYAPSALVLTIGKGEDPATATVERAVTLSCSPTPSGTHPAPKSACAELKAIDGDLARLAVAWSASSPCTHLWDPITVTGDGVWEGKRINWSATYGNTCQMHTGLARNSVFSF